MFRNIFSLSKPEKTIPSADNITFGFDVGQGSPLVNQSMPYGRKITHDTPPAMSIWQQFMSKAKSRPGSGGSYASTIGILGLAGIAMFQTQLAEYGSDIRSASDFLNKAGLSLGISGFHRTHNFVFEPGASQLSAFEDASLEWTARAINTNPDFNVHITGCSNRPQETVNTSLLNYSDLSTNPAQSVFNRLADMNVSRNRMTVNTPTCAFPHNLKSNNTVTIVFGR